MNERQLFHLRIHDSQMEYKKTYVFSSEMIRGDGKSYEIPFVACKTIATRRDFFVITWLPCWPAELPGEHCEIFGHLYPNPEQ